MSNAAIYVRISQDRGGAGLGVTRQEDDCRQLCEQHGWAVHEVYVDNDTSAYSGKPRPAYARMMDALAAGEVDTIVCWHPDRLHRSPRELEDFIDAIERTRGAVATVTAGDYDLSTADGRFTARIVGSVARKESEDKSRRLARKHLELAQKGQVSGGGSRPFGYCHDKVTLRVDEVKLVREAAQRALAGEGLRGICRDWNERGVTTVTGAKWTPIVLKRILTAPRTAGWREHQGTWSAPAVWPAILDKGTVERLRILLLDRNRRYTRDGGVVRSYLLTGFVVCSKCGAKMIARPKGDGRRTYFCAKGPGFSGCNGTTIGADALEDAVAELIFTWLDALPDPTPRDDPSSTALDAIAADEEALEQLARDFYVDRAIPRHSFLAAQSALQERIASARRLVVKSEEAGRARDLMGRGATLRSEWGSYSFDQRRAIVASCLESVTIGPGRKGLNRFDPTRLQVGMRDREA